SRRRTIARKLMTTNEPRVLGLASALLAVAGCGGQQGVDPPNPSEPVPMTAVERHGALSITGGHVVDQSGQPWSVAGPSFFWGNAGWGDGAPAEPSDYFNPDVLRYVQSEWNAAIVRIPMGAETPGGYIEDEDGRWARIVAAADAAIDEGMYVIVDWHSHHAEDHPEAAVAFFERVARQYGGIPNLIYEIYNEPLQDTDWSTVIKPYAERVIGAIRAIDPDNLIIVGTQSWSQDVDKAADDPILGFENIAYTLHFYAGTHGEGLRDKARYALQLGLPIVVTEWGTVNATGDGGVDADETDRWMTFLARHQLTHCNWSLHSKQEGASMLTSSGLPDAHWDEDSFTESGRLVREIIRKWHSVDYAGRGE
ncbi:MAG: glycoside hydrolase family 5 protein, partial [Myxococcota bacterium]